MFPESSAKRDREGLTPAQLAAHYEEAAEEEAVAALVRGARAEVRRNAEKLRRKAPPRAIERVALEAAVGALAATARLVGGLGLRAAKGALLPARARRDDESRDSDAANEHGSSSAGKSRRRKLFEGEAREASARSGGGKKRRGRERRALRRAVRRAVFGFLAKGGIAVGAAYGGALVASAAKRDLAPRLAAFRRERGWRPRANPAREAKRPPSGATPNADAIALARKRVHPNPTSVPAVLAARAPKPEPSVPAGLDAVPAAEAADVPAPAPVALLPEELVRIDTT